MILTERLLRNLNQTNIEPIMVLEIEGVPFIIGSDTIKRYPRYGDDELVYGLSGLYYGGLYPYPNQKTLISMEGTTTQIKQNLNPDKARATGVSQMTINLIDKNREGTKLLAGAYGEVLYKKVKVWISFGQSAWKEDFILVFRGVIESAVAEQGRVKLNLNSPQQKQRQLLAPKVETQLNGAINNSVTTITLDSTDNLLVVPDHPSYSPKDDDLATYVQIEDEIIQYTAVSGFTITGCTRGALGTVAASHADNTAVTSFYELEGHMIDLALKILLSDKDQTPYIDNLEATSVNFTDTGTVSNILWFTDADFSRDYNVQIGDYIKTTGFTNGGNNLSSWTEILDVVVTDTGSYIIVDAALVDEATTNGTVDFLSQWNSLGGFGLKLDTDEVDIDKHIQLKSSFLTSYNLRFFIRDEIEDPREWVEKELYLIAACYSLPSDRDGLSRLSIGIHKPPVPGTSIVTLDRESIVKPENLSIKRSINKYHYNAIVFKYEDTALDEKLNNRVVNIVGTPSISTGNKALVIESKGLKDFYNAKTVASDAGSRLLERYKDAAEHVEGMQVKFGSGVKIVVGDIVVFDPTGLNMINREDQNRSKTPLLMEVVNRDVDIKTGNVKLDLIDTSFDITAKFGLFSPSSKIVSAISTTKFVITYINGPSNYGSAEYRKWNGLKLPGVQIRNEDYTDVHYTKIVNISSNTITIQTAPSFAITPGDYVMEFAPYSNVNTTDEQKLIFAYWTDGSNPFPDTEPPYVFL
jgi:hypothetical protein